MALNHLPLNFLSPLLRTLNDSKHNVTYEGEASSFTFDSKHFCCLAITWLSDSKHRSNS